MTAVELSRPLASRFQRRVPLVHQPRHRSRGSAARASLGPDTAAYHYAHDLRPRSNPLGRMLLVLAMLASAGAGASLTFVIMDYQAKRPDAVAARSPARNGASAPAVREEAAVPHDIWAPFANSVPSVSEGAAPKGWPRPSVSPDSRALPSEPPAGKPNEASSDDAPTVTSALGPATMIPPTHPAAPMGRISSWRYQLQGIDPLAVARASDNDLMVVDYAGSRGPFTRADVERMRHKSDGSRRRVVSYLSIGEAEDYRFYWKSEWNKHRPGWLGAENSRWKKNYAVHFWDPQWQAIVFAYLDRIIAAGFDGIYLDRVDMFEQLGHADDMVDFVARLAARGKAARPDFMVISQNGDALLPKKKFRDSIDAFAREDLFYGEDRDGVRNKPDSIRDSIRRLKLFTAENKPVFVVEYPRTAGQAETARREIAEQGFIGLMAPRELNRL